MRIVVQKSGTATVTVGEDIVGQIDGGLVLLVGVHKDDTSKDADYLAEKIAHLRIFPDEDGKMGKDVKEAGYQILSISQFTLHGDVRKGRRPNYMDAAPSQLAEPIYQYFNQQLRAHGLIVETGEFGAMMSVQLINDGPVTILLDSHRVF